MKYSYAERLSCVKLVLESGFSTRSVAQKIGCAQKQLRLWVAHYKRRGESGLRLYNGHYDGTFKLSVLRHMEENQLSLFATAVEFGIPNSSSVASWYRIYHQEGIAGLYRTNSKPMKIPPYRKSANLSSQASLLEELEYLRAENAYLKKLRALVSERIERESGNSSTPLKN